MPDQVIPWDVSEFSSMTLQDFEKLKTLTPEILLLGTGARVTPRLNGLNYFEKPPLQYWATATFFSIFGERDAAARLWTALSAIAGVFLVFFSGRKLFSQQAGALGALVLAGCPLYVML